MRWVMYFLIFLMVGGIGVAIWQQESGERDIQIREELTREAVLRFRSVIRTQVSHAFIESGAETAPESVDPSWFGDDLPVNALLPEPGRPWVEVAGRRDRDREHPRALTAGEDAAQFWYNPANGIVRARVPVAIADEYAIRMYNAINGTSLRTLFPDR